MKWDDVLLMQYWRIRLICNQDLLAAQNSSSLVIIADDTVIATTNRLVMETDMQTFYYHKLNFYDSKE